MLYDLINICLKSIQNMGQLAFQNIILIYFKMKNILKNNRNHTPSKKNSSKRFILEDGWSVGQCDKKFRN